MAQKVGEEALETVIEATNGTEEGFIYEASDLVYHLIVLLTSKGYALTDIAKELEKRHKWFEIQRFVVRINNFIRILLSRELRILHSKL